MTTIKTFLALLATISAAGVAIAATTVIPAPGRVDMVHDFKRDRVYITAGTALLRYDRATSSFLAPLPLGGNLKGVDISLDGQRLAVADDVLSQGDVVVHVVDLDTLAVTDFRAPPVGGEAGTFSVAFGADGSLLTTSRYNGVGFAPMRRFDPSGTVHSIVLDLKQDSMVTASGDRRRAGIAENISSGAFGRYDFTTGTVQHRTFGPAYYPSTDVGVNRDGTQLAIPNFSGTFFFGDALNTLFALWHPGGAVANGIAYHPVENLVYMPWVPTNLVKVFETSTFTEVASIATSQTYGYVHTFPYMTGRTKLSADGSLLMVAMTDGVELIPLYAPLQAAPVAAATEAETPVTFPLAGSIGNGGTLAWSIDSPPGSGMVTLAGRNATYSPAAGFSGTDTFTYVVRYGEVEVGATATVTVSPPNRPPEALELALTTDEDRAVGTTLTASDPEGQPLVYSLVSQPSYGTLSGTAPNLTYIPKANYNGTDKFAYRANDGFLDSNIATVTITVRAVNDPPVARNDSFSMAGRRAAYIPVLANDSDPEGNPLTIVSVGQPTRGEVSIAGNQLYYKVSGFALGYVQFPYKITDGRGGYASATVTVFLN